MKHLSKIVLVSLLLSWFLPLSGTQAATPFITNIATYKSNETYIVLEWDVAESIEATGTIYYQESGDSSTRQTVSTDVENSPNFYRENVIKLNQNTSYTIWIEYDAGTTEDGTPLSSFSDFSEIYNKIVSYPYFTRSGDPNSYIDTYGTSYVIPGETIRVYGRNLGTGTNRDYSVAKLGPQEYGQNRLDGNYYEFLVTAWTSNYIDFTVPAYDADMAHQQGKLHLNDLIPFYDNYNGDLFIKVINDTANVDRAIASAYQGNEYRYLLNASRYRYNNRRTVALFAQEQEKMEWVSDYLTSIDRGIDATWSLVLAYGLVYGGYSQNEIQHEIHFGPGCLQANIPQSVWSQTGDYSECMANTI